MALEVLNASYGDRILIKWTKTTGDKKARPLVGLSESFDEPENGNKLTKSGTITYRGKANTLLMDFGTDFTLSNIVKNGESTGMFSMNLKEEGIQTEISIKPEIITKQGDEEVEEEIPISNKDEETSESDDFGFTL
jgi:hypothetical protein